LELVDSQGNTVDYFAWPVLPKDLREEQSEVTTVRKTIGAVYSLKNNTFTPSRISISGDFGRNFKILIGGQKIELAGFSASVQDGHFSISPPNLLDQKIPQFSSFAKTGYGCIKVLQAIKDKSKLLDPYNKPYSLYFYNPILGDNYQVEVLNFSHFQDDDNHNMLPGYTMQLISVAPLDSLFAQVANIKSAIKNMSFSAIQKRANDIAHNVKNIKSVKDLI